MKSKNKDRKPHESIIGKIIYGFLLFMPLLAIGVTCAYAIFNKNAYQSYYGDTINQTQYEQIEDNNETFFDNVLYRLITNRDTRTSNFTGTTYTFKNVSINSISNKSYERYFTSEMSIRFYYDTVNKYALTNNVNQTAYVTQSEINFDINFNFSNNTQKNSSNLNPYLYEVEYNSYSFVSEVFYYSIDKVQQSTLFNWAEDSAIYTGMTATCNTLNITTPLIPLLMTYWLIISVIYILYDIILVILHIFHKKIHQLEDSF